jgi:hypothetical protein
MRVVAACLLAVLSALAWSGSARAQQISTLDSNPISTPDLGVDAQGGAVVAWVGFAPTTAASGVTTFVDSVQVSVRPPGGMFTPATPVSDLGSDVTRDLALAVGRRGDAALVWRAEDEESTEMPFVASRKPAGGEFGRPTAIRGSDGGRDATVAVGGEGSVLVAWLDGSGRRGCGSVVWASRAKADGQFTPAVRVSAPCANASAPRAALGPDGRGAVAWRARPSGGESELQAAAFRMGRFHPAREVSRAPISAVDFDIVGDRTGATLAWRDAGGNVSARGDVGRVLAARIAGGLVPRPRVVADGGRFAGPPRLAANAAGSALLVFEQAPLNRPLHRPSVFASRRRSIGGRFGKPQVVAVCGAADASRTFAFGALDAGDVATIVFQTACGAPLGIGSNYGLAIASASPGDAWTAPRPLSSGGYAVGVKLGMSDDGGAIAAWTERAFGAPEAIEGLRVAILR